nr:hypothetical protein [Paenibacillus xylanexedens]
MKTFVVLGHSGKHEEADTKVVYVGTDEDKAFSWEGDGYIHSYSVELWLNEKQLKGWYGTKEEWKVEIDRIEELRKSIQWKQEQAEREQAELFELQEQLEKR